MASATTHSIWYVYGIVPEDTPATSAPAGIDDAGVAVERHAGDARRSSPCSANPTYAPAAIEANSGDVEWLESSRRRARSRADLGERPWRGRSAADVLAVQRRGRRASHVERAVVAARVDTRARGPRTRVRAARLSRRRRAAGGDGVAESAARASWRAPRPPRRRDRRYLLERKLDGERKTEMRAVTQRIVEEIVDALSPHAASVAALADSEGGRRRRGGTRHDGAQRRVSRRAGVARGISENAHDARRASRTAWSPI